MEDAVKIKRLSVQGFKSFMDRLDLSFAEGISGIVGPNGCGKSNVVDAIRWCLGEQSPKQLRGRKMEDVIFGGAKDCKPLGMAEVTITFENGDGSFPPAFENHSELSVTRRLYRSGESEYRINNMPCRLKDVQEIFMDTGLGNRAYSIIGQGKIGSIVEQRPEETRVMLEEAAGITKYRKKVEESEKKIEATEANLQRVEDILSEVRSQMRSLQRQATKARQYKTICEEIRRLELILYSNSFNLLKDESQDKLKSSEHLVEQEVDRTTGLAGLQAQIETMHLTLEEQDNNISGLRNNYLHLRERVQKKEAGLESLDMETKMQEELETRLRAEEDEIRIRLAGLKQEKADLENGLEAMKQKALDLDGEIALKDKRLKNRKESLDFVRSDYEKARERLTEGTNKEVGLKHKSEYLNKMLDQITDGRSRLEKDMSDIKARMENLLLVSERKNQVRETANEKKKEIEAAIEDLNMAYQELEMIKGRVENELRSAESEYNMVRSRLSSLQSLSENFEGYKTAVRTIMKSNDCLPMQQGHVLGLVADILKVAPEHEQAVEAALADRVQYIIVESQEDGRLAIEYLKERARGRGSFVPLKDITENHRPAMDEKTWPVLSDLVSVPEAYRPLINALLGDTLLTPDLSEALSAWSGCKENSGHNGRRLCFVTPEGDMVDDRGVISGGRLSKTSAGLLARKREMAELETIVVQRQRQVDDLRLKLENIIGDAQEKKAEIADLTHEKTTRQDEINELDKHLFRLGQEMDQLDRLSKKLSEDLERNSTDEGKNREELSRIESELLDHKTACQEEEEYFRKKEIELKETQAEFEELRDELLRLKGDYRLIEEEQRGIIRQMERLDQYAHDGMTRLKKIEEDIALGRGRCELCEKNQQEIRLQLRELYDRLKGAEEDLNRADAERQTFQAMIKDKEKAAEQVRKELDDLKEEINRARMEHSEIQYKMNNLTEVVREKFNLDLNEIYEQYLMEDFSHSDMDEQIERQKEMRQRLGEVNLLAIKEHEALQERHEFIQTQREDLLKSIEALKTAIKKINQTSLEKFQKALADVDEKLKEVFPVLFGGGTASLKLTDETRPLESGVLVEVQPPGKKLSHMGLLSGGEKALVAMALLFAIYMIKPSPFCLLDEVDAPLDEANIDRFNNLLGEIKRASQVIMVTHSRRTMEIVDRLFGITMEKAGMSKVVSVDIKGVRDQNFATDSLRHGQTFSSIDMVEQDKQLLREVIH
ncbi:Chromosome partition protein Smc [uncultured Desulfobacterium sp.]|uniref:Chromosome partition protein Smc n=1 Tax=uncultured Desulfobacterium sp. TaxID=201089 RepID=A0A445MYS6_9BACT|nr:Chromosome partition protein Smc [uncultured Desulfobacterium sp.]